MVGEGSGSVAIFSTYPLHPPPRPDCQSTPEFAVSNCFRLRPWVRQIEYRENVGIQEISNGRTHCSDPEKTWVSNISSNLLRGPLVRSHSIFDGRYHSWGSSLAVCTTMHLLYRLHSPSAQKPFWECNLSRLFGSEYLLKKYLEHYGIWRNICLKQTATLYSPSLLAAWPVLVVWYTGLYYPTIWGL